MDNFYQQPRPFNPYQTQSYMPPYNGTIISVKGAEGCNAFKIEDVDCELKQAEEKMMKLAAAGYDMIYILDEQEWLKEKYTKKTRVD